MRLGLVDTVIVVLAALALDLSLLWAASRVAGVPQFETLPDFFASGITALFGFLTGGSALLVGYWKRRANPRADGPSFLFPILGTALALLVVVFVISDRMRAFGDENTGSDERADLAFDLILDGQAVPVVDTAMAPALAFIQHTGEYAEDGLSMQGGVYRRRSIILPSVGENYSAIFRRQPNVSVLSDEPPENFLTPICFEYRAHAPSNAEVYLACRERRNCQVKPESQQWARTCGSANVATAFAWPRLISPAWADPPSETKSPPGWIAPSLSRLRAMGERERSGYTVFEVRSEPLPGLDEAAAVSADVFANGTPVYFDGWPHGYRRERFDPAAGVSVDFALENLNFRGEEKGQDRITLRLTFYDAKGKPIPDVGPAGERFIELSRLYVPLRDPTPETLAVVDAIWRWSGRYVKAIDENAYTVVLLSSTDERATLEEFERLNRKELKFASQKMVGVLRPPREDNPRWGIAMGVVQDTGQVQFTYSQEEAARTCDAVLSIREQPGLHFIRADAYRYEIDTRQARPCRQIVR